MYVPISGTPISGPMGEAQIKSSCICMNMKYGIEPDTAESWTAPEFQEVYKADVIQESSSYCWSLIELPW